MNRREWFFIWLAGTLACILLYTMCQAEWAGVQEPQEIGLAVPLDGSKQDVVITGVYSVELFSGEVSYYVNYLVGAVPATHDFKDSESAMAFIRLLEGRYNAAWMHN